LNYDYFSELLQSVLRQMIGCRKPGELK
jgi:hypothetical protein